MTTGTTTTTTGAGGAGGMGGAGGAGGAPATATATIDSIAGSGVSGEATFIRAGNEIKLVVDVAGAPAGGVHGVSIHENASCAHDGADAGGHWNPLMTMHGKWGQGEYHLGDIGNVTIGQDGKGRITLTTDEWSLGDSGEPDVSDHAIIVHANADDYTTQPDGDEGAPVACGVIHTKP